MMADCSVCYDLDIKKAQQLHKPGFKLVSWLTDLRARAADGCKTCFLVSQSVLSFREESWPALESIAVRIERRGQRGELEIRTTNGEDKDIGSSELICLELYTLPGA